MRKLATLILLLGLAAAAFFYRDELIAGWGDLRANFSRLSQDQLLPPPLRGPFGGESGHLTAVGVIEHTNIQRNANGRASLNGNAQLAAAAKIKLDDMFDQQYFEHISPQGTGPSDLAKQSGYEYIVVGENLAMGNFKDDRTLVEAWMDSPGHRANILNQRYQDIGVAVGRGTFEGKTVWLAVQEFGTPLSACPQPSDSLKYQIDSARSQLANLQATLAVLKKDLESGRYQDEEYNRKVGEYNALVGQANRLIDRIRIMAGEYNAEASRFNACVNQ